MPHKPGTRRERRLHRHTTTTTLTMTWMRTRPLLIPIHNAQGGIASPVATTLGGFPATTAGESVKRKVTEWTSSSVRYQMNEAQTSDRMICRSEREMRGLSRGDQLPSITWQSSRGSTNHHIRGILKQLTFRKTWRKKSVIETSWSRCKMNV